jgi:glycosyltransferase involved in cell wall biosynthesis
VRILIDCTQIPVVRTGVGVYADNLVRELLSRLMQQDSLFVLIQSDELELKNCVQDAPRTRFIVIPSTIFRHHVTLALFEQLILPLIALVYRLDIIHSIHYRFPLFCLCDRIVTIHDLTHSLFPEMHTFGRRIVVSFFSRMARKRAEGLLFDSSSTQRDFGRMLGPYKHCQFVAPLGVSPALFRPPLASAISNTLRQHGIQKPFVLFLGTVEPRKNLARLIEAFEGIGTKHPECLLVIAGRLGWSYEQVLSRIECSPRKSTIVRLGYVSSADKHALLAACEVLVYPSLYEGFGLPVLEGMAMGKPVITSNVSSMLEVAGDGALTIDPTDTQRIQESLERVLSDPDLQKLLGEKGRRQAARFTWGQTADLTYKAYRAVLKRREAIAQAGSLE